MSRSQALATSATTGNVGPVASQDLPVGTGLSRPGNRAEVPGGGLKRRRSPVAGVLAASLLLGGLSLGGLAATPARFRMRGLRAATPVHGLYLTGADLVAPGVGGALFGGVTAASAILGRNMIRAIAGREPAVPTGTRAAA